MRGADRGGLGGGTCEVDGGDRHDARVALEHAVRGVEAVEVGAGGGGDAEAGVAGRRDHREDAPAEGGAERLKVVQRKARVEHVARHALRLQRMSRMCAADVAGTAGAAMGCGQDSTSSSMRAPSYKSHLVPLVRLSVVRGVGAGACSKRAGRARQRACSVEMSSSRWLDAQKSAAIAGTERRRVLETG